MPNQSSGIQWNPLATPFRDVLYGLEHCLVGYRELLLVGLGLAAGWWVYVPVHELLHALGCVATGGSVSRLEIARLYGGQLWAALFPFVEAGGDYAGRLSGFDTGGSDLVYLATVLAPYLLTLFPGVWALRRAARRGRAFAFGFAVPLALAPFVSLTGDAYEVGSIVTTWWPAWSPMAESLRGDDLFRLIGELRGRPEAPWGGVLAGGLTGMLWAFLTYAAGRWIASALGEKQAAPEA